MFNPVFFFISMEIQASQITQSMKDANPRLVEAARAMEANFLKQLIRAMRKSVLESDETKNNRTVQIFREMLDNEYAESASQRGLGISNLIIQHLLSPTAIARPETRSR